MFNRIIKAIVNKLDSEEVVGESIIVPPPPLPDLIEVPFEDVRDVVVSSGNIRELKRKLNNYIIEAENEKQRIHRLIVELEEVTIRLSRELREKYNVPTNPRYVLKLPTIRGAEGLFARVKEVEEEGSQNA